MSKKHVRFQSDRYREGVFGTLEDEQVSVLTKAPWNGGEETGESLKLGDVTLIAPVQPSKIVCIGLNYHAHVDASFSADKVPERPLIFLKPPSSIIGPGDTIVHPPESERVDYEAELGVVISRRGRHIKAEDADDYIFGFTCVNDVTARDLQKVDGQWSRAKGFDTFCPVGPWIVTQLDYQDVLVEGIHRGEVKQSGRTAQMIFDIPYLIAYISAAMTLNPGDLISTGTPSGIAPMLPGDTIEVKIEGVGSLINTVAAP
jgi:2-keto-4-pentenoate hydratase/2-oxohepta-3-ene-1,7-dioic acid hydratase in catechol pathway